MTSKMDNEHVVTCIATCFGYKDPGDDGKGAFGDNNNDPKLVGVSIPIPIIKETIGYEAELVHKHSVMVKIGDKVIKSRITDSGPGEKGALIWGRKDGLGHVLDLNKGACDALGIKYDPVHASYKAQWWLVDEVGNVLEIKGLDAPRHYV